MKKVLLGILIAFCCLHSFAQEIPENLTDAEKIYGLSKIWKEADKNFVFFDQVPDIDWEESYKTYIPKVLNTKTTYEYYKVLQTFYHQLNDGHTRVVVPWQLRRIHEVRPPLRTTLIQGKLFITEIKNDTLQSKGLKIGQEVIAIDGMDVESYAKKNVIPYAFYSTEQDMKIQVYTNHLLRGHRDKPVELKVKDGRRTKVISIDRKMTTKKKERKSPYSFKTLENNVGYLKLTAFWGKDINKSFDELFEKIQKTDALIIDVSVNSGGNSGYANYVLKHFMDKPFETSRWKTIMYLPAYASWNNTQKWFENEGSIIKPNEESKRYDKNKKIVVLISEETYSAGEDFVSAFLLTNRGKVIGRPTAGSTGNPIGFALPGKGGFQVCTKRDYLPNGVEFVGYGIQPQLFLEKKIDNQNLVAKAQTMLK